MRISKQAVALTGTLVGSIIGSGVAEPCGLSQYYSDDLDAIVVGAGMSGLAAAATLIKRGKNVIVLEGRDEVGGRMRTKTDFGEHSGDYKGVIELGANWIYGGYGPVDHYDDPNTDGPINFMKNFALDAGVEFMEEAFNGKGIDAYDLTRAEGDRRLNFRELQEYLANFRPKDRCLTANAVTDIFSMLEDNPTASLGSNNLREGLGQCDWDPAGDPMNDLLEVVWYDNEVLSRPEDASVSSFIPWGYEDFGPQVLYIKGQNGGLTEVARKYAELNNVSPKIVFNAKVTTIEYGQDPAKVWVELGEGSQACYVESKKVLFTGSPGVVDKMDLDSGFNPVLGNLNQRQVELRTWIKVFFQFPEAFWNNSPRPGPNPVDSFNYIFTAEQDNRKGCNIWFNFDYVASFRATDDERKNRLLPGSRILFGWVPQHIMDEFGGSEGYVFDYHDLESEDGDVARLLAPLKAAYGDAFMMPTAAYASDWQNDEFTYGSWNAFKDDESLDNSDYYEFYQPRNERLWLSGASSCRRSYRNMQGAYFAGVRDGEWAADCLEAGYLTKRPESVCDVYDFPLPGSAMMEGDPHVKTWGGNWFDYHGQCDLVLLHAPNFDGQGRDLLIHVRTTLRYEYSYIESAAIKIGEDVLEVGSFGDFALNGVDTPNLREENQALAGYSVHHTQAESLKHSFDIVLSKHENITISTYKDIVKVSVEGGWASARFFHKSVGMMGSYKGTLFGRDGVTNMENDINAFGQEWQVTDKEPMLFQKARAPQFPRKCVLPGPRSANQRRLEEIVQEASAEAACAYLMQERSRFDNCVVDVMAFGDVEVAKTYN